MTSNGRQTVFFGEKHGYDAENREHLLEEE